MDWLLMFLNLYSYFLIGNKKSIGFIISALASVMGIFYFIKTPSMLIMYSAFAILNIKGYVQWRRDYKRGIVP